MTEPTTANRGIIVPNTGDLVGAWGTAALNLNAQQFDGLFGGVTSISLSAATTITLTTTTASFTPGGGPNQSDCAAISLSGTLTGNAVIKLSAPGMYRVLNNCTVGTSYVQLAPASGVGSTVGCPDGEFRRFFFDGTNVYMMDMPHVGTIVDWCVSTSPVWFNACTVKPYLLCDGTLYTSSIFPALNARVGSTFGGDGSTRFGVPDMANRYRIPLDLGATGRITAGVAGFAGTTWGASGGSQNFQQHTHTTNDPGHTHSDGSAVQGAAGSVAFFAGNTGSAVSGSATTGITINNAGSGASGNIPPGIVFGLCFIKT